VGEESLLYLLSLFTRAVSMSSLSQVLWTVQDMQSGELVTGVYGTTLTFTYSDPSAGPLAKETELKQNGYASGPHMGFLSLEVKVHGLPSERNYSFPSLWYVRPSRCPCLHLI